MLPIHIILRWTVAIALGFVIDAVCVAQDPYSPFVASTQPLAPAEQQRKFRLPPGFEIQLVAAEPNVRKPVNLNFDAHGRLLVTGSVEYPHSVEKDDVPRDVIKVLTDKNRDGVFEDVKTFADGLNIPIGVTPVLSGVMAYSIPNVDWFGHDDDGRRARKVVYRGFDSEDTHGMPSSFTWWIDGWVYACHGEGNTSTIAGTDGQSITMNGGNTFRMKPDGSHIEHFTRGQANPFGLCFDPLGNLYSADSHSKPAYLLLRGAWYPGLTRRHDGLGFGPELMRHYHGSTGIAGVAYYAAEHFPAEYRDTLFIGNPVTGRINHDQFAAHGSTYRAIQQPDFLTCDDPWFRPVDIQLGPDGALYIADFYNRIIGHNVVPHGHAQRDRQRGRIWRVVYTGKDDAKRLRPAPDLATVTTDKLIDYLRDPNLVVRTHATHQLVERVGKAAIPSVKRLLAGHSHPWQRVHALWVLHRLDALDEHSIVRLAGDPNRAVRVHLLKVLAEQSDWDEQTSARYRVTLSKLSDPDAFVRRAAADVLARHPADANLRPLLNLWAKTPKEDTMLIHVVRMAVRDNLGALGNIVEFAKRSKAHPDVARRLADVSLGLPTKQSAEFVLRHLQSDSYDAKRLGELLQHVGRHLDDELLPRFYSFAQTFQEEPGSSQRTVLRSLHRAAEARGVALPKEITAWGLATARGLLASEEEFSVYAGVELAWDLKLKELGAALARLAGKSSPQSAVRSVAMDALAAVDQVRGVQVLEKTLDDLTEPSDVRQKAADTLGKINSDRSRSVLGRHLPPAPAGLATTIARRLAVSRDGADLLLKTVSQGKASAHLLQDAVVDLRLRENDLPGLNDRLTKLVKDLPAEDIRLRRLVAQRQFGFTQAQPNLQRGARVFEKSCGICHQIDGKGSKVGPPLDGAGLRGLERLLEDTLMPSRNVEVNYRSSVISLADGRLVTGLVLREEGQTIVIADAEGKELRIPTGEVQQRRFSKLSSMPANVAEKISENDFYDLIGYLLDQREPTKQAAGQSPKRKKAGASRPAGL